MDEAFLEHAYEDKAFRIGEGQDGWVEESFVHLDHALVLARERGLGVIVVLTNRWPDYGGIAQHAEWSGLPVQYCRWWCGLSSVR